MILITFCSLKRMKTCTTLSRRFLMSTLLETIHAMTRHTFPTFTKMIIVIFSVEFSITFVTVIRAIKKHTKWRTTLKMLKQDLWNLLRCWRTLKNNHARFTDRQRLKLVLATQYSLKLFHFAHTHGLSSTPAKQWNSCAWVSCTGQLLRVLSYTCFSLTS